MVALGFGFFGLMLYTLFVWYRGGLKPDALSAPNGLWLAWMAALPLGYVAMEAGWVTREVGRQPWIIYGVLRTGEAASPLPAWPVGGSLALFAVVYLLLFLTAVYFAARIIRRGPDSGNSRS